MKRMILMLASVLPLVTFAQNLVTAEALKLIEGSQADVLYANEFGAFRNDELDVPFPYCVIRIELEGDVEKAKNMLSLDVGSMFKVEDKNIFKDNMILFLIRSSVRQVYLQCGDGCKPQQLHYGTLQANKVYACKVTFKAAERNAVDNSDAILAQVAAMQKQMEEMQKQNQLMQQALQNQLKGSNNSDSKYSQESVTQTPKYSSDDILPIVVNGVKFNMIKVEGGTFRMGSNDGEDDERPVHKVTLSDYYIGETEVTQELWTAVMGTTVSQQRDKVNNICQLVGVGDNYPMYYISWNECKVFVQKLNELTGLRFALPTEAQWEFAAQGGKKSHGYKYSGSNDVGSVAWYYYNSSKETHPVGSKQANELGIYDMSGNVWEWCLDWKGTYHSRSVTNPTGPSSGSSPVDRGGSWSSDAGDCRPAFRGNLSTDYRDNYIGFRLALQVPTR